MITTSTNPRRIKYRRPRIAFSAVCGILCLLLIVLSVQSYSQWGQLHNWNISKHPIIVTIGASYFLAIGLTMMAAAVSWLPLSKRFSLRTLLIATTVVAALLGAVKWAVK